MSKKNADNTPIIIIATEIECKKNGRFLNNRQYSLMLPEREAINAIEQMLSDVDAPE